MNVLWRMPRTRTTSSFEYRESQACRMRLATRCTPQDTDVRIGIDHKDVPSRHVFSFGEISTVRLFICVTEQEPVSFNGWLGSAVRRRSTTKHRSMSTQLGRWVGVCEA